MASAYVAVISVMSVMDNLKFHPHPPISLHPQQAESLTQHLTFLEDFLEKYDQNLPYSTEADPFESRIADAAYAAEDAIESHIADRITSSDGDGINSSDGSLYEALEKVIQEMEFIEKEAIAIKQNMAVVGVQHQLQAKSTPMDSSRSSSIEEKSSMVGVDDLFLQMKDKLVSDRRDRQIISIVGMGGTGKTTLALNIYQDFLIKEHFDIRAWATISQEYSIRDILIQVLSQLYIEVDKHSSEIALGEILYKHLLGRRYLIVMDDVWSIRVWDEIRRFLPDNKNGSRIVVTTRLSNLASQLPNSSSLEMELLDETDSWNLLSEIVFWGHSCPPELEDIGKEIAKSCKGLPLSIVVVGGFLAKSECTREFWKYTKENLSSIMNLEDDERSLKILYMSYKQLPIYLKPCFLYLGVFPENDVIHISKLVKLWVAEGFIKPISWRNTLEEIARVYLQDLADRNLVLIDKKGFAGNIKSLRIHNLLRDLCLREVEKERFYTLTPQGIVNGQRRIVISNTTSKNGNINALSSMSFVRSLIWNLDDQELPQVNLRLLRILDSQRHRFIAGTKFVENVHHLVNSRFLQFPTPSLVLEFPLSIWKFWNLQTLIVNGFQNEVNAPIDIWYMPHIRHLLFLHGIELPDPPKDQDGIVLGNLQTLGEARNFKCSDQVVKRIPNIKKLNASYFGGSLEDDRVCLTNLDRLDKLESLTYNIYQGMNPSGTVSLHSQINFPHSLKKLCLEIRKSEYWEQELLDKIGVLPLLQKLRLISGRFKDGQWETTEGQFRSLKFLFLHRCENLQAWTTESSHFPCLSNLRLLGLMNYGEIPIDFAEVSTLRVIEVYDCCDSIVVSAKRILEEYEELYGEADLEVQVTFWGTKRAALESLRGPNFRVNGF